MVHSMPLRASSGILGTLEEGRGEGARKERERGNDQGGGREAMTREEGERE